MTLTTSAHGRNLIATREGMRLTAYLDSVGVVTVGVGHTGRASPPDVHMGMTITAAQADAFLSNDLVQFERAILKAVTVPLQQNEFDALASLAFNIGATAFSGSTVVRRLNNGDTAGAADAFMMWDKAGGKVLAGLQTRRQGERQQFLTPYPTAVASVAPKPVAGPAPPILREPAPIPVKQTWGDWLRQAFFKRSA